MRRNPPQPDIKLELVTDFVNLLMEPEYKRLRQLIDDTVMENNQHYPANNRYRHNGKVWQLSDPNITGRELASPLHPTLEAKADMLSTQWELALSDKKRMVQCLRLLINHAAEMQDWRNLLPDEFAKFFKDPVPRTKQQIEVWQLTEPQKKDYYSVLLVIQKYSGLAMFM